MITVEHLTKYYGDHLAVDDISFEISGGQVYGFLGPNGAGKSTTMNIMTGCLAATEGEIKIDGLDIYEDADKAKRLIGYLPEQPPLYPNSTPREYLQFVAEAKGVEKNAVKTELERVMGICRISDVADRLIKNLSKGYKQRVGIAQALLGNPEIIILDEPTVGLDPIQIIEIRELIKSLGEKHTVILSSHILSEVQAVCTTVLIISKGKLVACDTTENLEKLFCSGSRLEIVTESTPENVAELLDEMDAEISAQEDGKIRIAINTENGEAEGISRAVSLALSGAGLPILSMNTSKASLEDIFIELTNSETGVNGHEGNLQA